MYFQIAQDATDSRFYWLYRQGTSDNPGASICTSDTDFGSEREARSHIAATKKAFAAARMAKVESPEETA